MADCPHCAQMDKRIRDLERELAVMKVSELGELTLCKLRLSALQEGRHDPVTHRDFTPTLSTEEPKNA